MAIQAIIDSAVLLAYFAVSIDIVIQILHILKRKSSKDVSIKGSLIRLIAISIFLIKFITETDLVLIIGQAVSVMLFIVYFGLLVYYRK